MRYVFSQRNLDHNSTVDFDEYWYYLPYYTNNLLFMVALNNNNIVYYFLYLNYLALSIFTSLLIS